MKLDPEKFKIIPSNYNGIDFMKLQYEDKDLVMKLKGEFFIIDVKNYGLRLVFTPDNKEIIDKIYELGGFQNKNFSFHEQNNSIFQSQKHSNGSKQMQIKTRRPKNQDAWMRRGCFSSFSIIYDRLNAYAKQVKVNEFLKEEKIESMFDEED